jgi:hypothetical protein
MSSTPGTRIAMESRDELRDSVNFQLQALARFRDRPYHSLVRTKDSLPFFSRVRDYGGYVSIVTVMGHKGKLLLGLVFAYCLDMLIHKEKCG